MLHWFRLMCRKSKDILSELKSITIFLYLCSTCIWQISDSANNNNNNRSIFLLAHSLPMIDYWAQKVKFVSFEHDHLTMKIIRYISIVHCVSMDFIKWQDIVTMHFILLLLVVYLIQSGRFSANTIASYWLK